MFGSKKKASAPVQAKGETSEVTHQFDQTNGVMAAFERYQNAARGDAGASPDDASKQRQAQVFSAAAAGGSLSMTH